MATRGYVTVGRIQRVPVRVHLATPLGLFVFTQGSTNPILWAGFVFVVLVHELGHAVLVRRYRLSPLSIDINGIGGVCRYTGSATEVEESERGELAQGARGDAADGGVPGVRVAAAGPLRGLLEGSSVKEANRRATEARVQREAKDQGDDLERFMEMLEGNVRHGRR